MILMKLKIVNGIVACDFEEENPTQGELEIVNILSQTLQQVLDTVFGGNFYPNHILSEENEIIPQSSDEQ